MSDSDDEPMALSARTLAALAEFNAERDAHARQLERLKADADADAEAEDGVAMLSMDAFAEDWNASQFWYADDTAATLAAELLEGATPATTIAAVCAPSAFVALKNALRTKSVEKRPRLVLLEHDDRFAVFGHDFVFYDFQQPLKLPAELKGSVDRIICDPPFLSQDCQAKIALTSRWLLKPVATKAAPRVVVITGERIETLVTKLYQPFGVRPTTFEVRHARGLSNHFYCYASFEGPSWTW